MEEARLLVPVPEPVASGCAGACLSKSEADEWRACDPGRYCDWVVETDHGEPVAPVAGAWKVRAGMNDVLWSTGLPFERIMALFRRAALALRSDGLTADEAGAAHADFKLAEAACSTWRTSSEIFEHVPEISEEGLATFAAVAWAATHALAIRDLADAGLRAGLWRSLARAVIAREERVQTEAGREALRAASVYAECEVLRQSAAHHFDACRAGAARACAARAVERARAVHHEDARLVSARRVETLQNEFDRMHAVAERVDGGIAAGRVFDASLLCPCVDLPVL